MHPRCALSSLVLAALGLLRPASGFAADAAPLFSDPAILELTLRAPLRELFTAGPKDDKYSVPATIQYSDPATSAPVAINDVRLSLRGHTSKRETECTFPKLKLQLPPGPAIERSIFAGLSAVRIGTHCGENPGEQLTAEFGRLANETSPLREVFVYHLLEVVGVPSLKARAARITYIDTAGGATDGAVPLTRGAMLLEDEDAAKARLGGARAIPLEQFTTARERFREGDTARLAFAEAMVGNFDWCLRLYDGDTYRCDAKLPLWNILAFERPEAPPVPVIADFDLAGTVVGRHNWFDKVYGPGFVPSGSSIEVEVISQVQRTRSLFSREVLDGVRRGFLDRREAAYAALEDSGLDARGRDLARQHLDAFFSALTDAAFYRPVITRPNTPVYRDAAKSAAACAAGEHAPAGTPVAIVSTDGDMAEVALLDVHWRWAPPRNCPAVRTGTVWVERSAIDANYPAATRP